MEKISIEGGRRHEKGNGNKEVGFSRNIVSGSFWSADRMLTSRDQEWILKLLQVSKKTVHCQHSKKWKY